MAWSKTGRSELEIDERADYLLSLIPEIVNDPANRHQEFHLDLDTGECCLDGSNFRLWQSTRLYDRIYSGWIGIPSDRICYKRWLQEALSDDEAQRQLDYRPSEWERLLSFKQDGDELWHFDSSSDLWAAKMGRAGVALVRRVSESCPADITVPPFKEGD